MNLALLWPKSVVVSSKAPTCVTGNTAFAEAANLNAAWLLSKPAMYISPLTAPILPTCVPALLNLASSPACVLLISKEWPPFLENCAAAFADKTTPVAFEPEIEFDVVPINKLPLPSSLAFSEPPINHLCILAPLAFFPIW